MEGGGAEERERRERYTLYLGKPSESGRLQCELREQKPEDPCARENKQTPPTPFMQTHQRSITVTQHGGEINTKWDKVTVARLLGPVSREYSRDFTRQEPINT